MSEWSFDTLAASLRMASRDLKTFHEVLAAKLAGALGDEAVTVRRRGLPWQKERPLAALVVNLGDLRLEAERAGAAMQYRVVKLVRGIALKSEAVPLETWLEALTRGLWEHAKASEVAQAALERFLLGPE